MQLLLCKGAARLPASHDDRRLSLCCSRAKFCLNATLGACTCHGGGKRRQASKQGRGVKVLVKRDDELCVATPDHHLTAIPLALIQTRCRQSHQAHRRVHHRPSLAPQAAVRTLVRDQAPHLHQRPSRTHICRTWRLRIGTPMVVPVAVAAAAAMRAQRMSCPALSRAR